MKLGSKEYDYIKGLLALNPQLSISQAVRHLKLLRDYSQGKL